MKRFTRPAAVAAAALLSAVAAASGQQVNSPGVTVVADHPSGVYHAGETAHFTVEWKGPGPAPADAKYTFKAGGLKPAGGGDLTFDGGKATVDYRLPDANTVLVSVTWGGSPKNLSCGGAVADPDRIRPAAPCPDDFDAFWKAQLDRVAKVPAAARVEDGDAGVAGVTYAKVTLDAVGGTHVDGQVARPAAGEKFPAVLVLQYAGVYALQPSAVTGLAKQGWLAMDIEAHDVPVDRPAAFYQGLYGGGGALNNYWMIGNQDRDTSYYLGMYQRMVQALHYLRSRPDWDGRTVVVTGQSQGGEQALALAGLCPDEVSAALTLVPAGCDEMAPGLGRAAGFPNWWDQTWGGRDAAKVRQASRYFDPTNFAPRIKCPVLVAYGLHDNLAPPSSVLATVNQITAPKEVLVLPLSGHMGENNTQQPYYDRLYGGWLPALAKGERPPVAAAP